VPPVAEQTVAVGAGSVQSAVFNNNTNLVQLCADVNCSVEFGTNPTATTTTMRLPSNVIIYFGLAQTGLRLAVIANT
jgi:hypothetical protein